MGGEQTGMDSGLDVVVDALQEVLARLLAEEKDLAKLAMGVARVSAAAVQVAREQRARGAEEPNDLDRALHEVLGRFEGGRLPLTGPDDDDEDA